MTGSEKTKAAKAAAKRRLEATEEEEEEEIVREFQRRRISMEPGTYSFFFLSFFFPFSTAGVRRRKAFHLSGVSTVPATTHIRSRCEIVLDKYGWRSLRTLLSVEYPFQW